MKLNQRNPEVQQYHFDTVKFWVEQFDIDGIRLDAAGRAGLWLYAEPAPVHRRAETRLLADGRGDPRGLQPVGQPPDPPLGDQLRAPQGLWSGHNDHNYFEIAHTMRRLQGLCGDTRLYTFSDNHDVERLPNKLRTGPTSGISPSWCIPCGNPVHLLRVRNSASRARRNGAATGPCVPAWTWPTTRMPSPKTRSPASTPPWAELKAEEPALTWGKPQELILTTERYAFVRTLEGRSLVTVLNNADAPAHLR